MDSEVKKTVLRTIVAHENRMTTVELINALRDANSGFQPNDLQELLVDQTLALVSGTWIVQQWWKVK